METIFAIENDNALSMVGATNGEAEYLLWKKSDDEPSQIYFEADSQINSGYNIVEECTIDSDGCHIVLNSGELIHFYWHPPRHSDLTKFVSALRDFYPSNSILVSHLS